MVFAQTSCGRIKPEPEPDIRKGKMKHVGPFIVFHEYFDYEKADQRSYVYKYIKQTLFRDFVRVAKYKYKQEKRLGDTDWATKTWRLINFIFA